MTITDTVWVDLLQSKQAFLETVVDPMIGWLDRYAAKRTLDLLEYQERNAVDGSLYEVGIYHGKYFSLLARSAALTGSKVVGIDLFDYLTPERFRAYFDEKFSPTNLAAVASNFRWMVIEGSSGDISAGRLLKELGSEARFISIDGSHEYDDVMWDLRVAEQVLAPAGVISVDDIINPICLGVAAATYHFLDSTPTLAPFAHMSNKFFLCRPGWADRYRSALESAVLADEAEPKSNEYRSHYDAGARRNIENVFRGYRILTIRL